ncbi:MAG: hypothetical protein KGY54_10865 [Oleiphilaceae bacterium]|nr:hypothetical protein [Oleiphilaceae bacterium]
MKYFDEFFAVMFGLFLPALALGQSPDRMGEGMMNGWMTPGMGIMGILMMILWILLVVLLVLAILALIKYLRKK